MVRSRQAWADALRNEWEIETPSSSALSDIFSEEPPDLTTFVQDKKFLANLPLGEAQFDFVRHFEQILKPETYILMVEEFGPSWVPVRFTNEFAVEWGKGSGKDHCCQICFARVANILVSLKSPQDYYGMPHQTIIHAMNVAASAPQAHGVFFKPLRTIITRSPWFSDKFEGAPPGPQATEIRFAKQIELISGHSEAETLEGKNLIAAIADEISAFPTLSEVAQSRTGRAPAKTSDGIIAMLKSSATTRFPTNFKLAQISYPRYKGDAIEQAVARGRADNERKKTLSRFYVSGPKATWDVNPRYDQFARVTVAGATEPVPDVPSIIEDYENDPAFARAKYECKPELAENRYFQNDSAIFDAFKEIRNEPITFEYFWGLDEGGVVSETQYFGAVDEPHIPGWQVRFHFASDFRPVHGALYAVHGDMAISGDRAGVAMAHVRTWDRKDWRQPGGIMLEQRPIVRLDFVAAFEADKAGQPQPREVQIRWYRKLIWELQARGFNIMLATFDNFQSADTIQILESKGIESKKVSTDRNNILWDTLRDVMYDGRLEGYWREEVVTEIQRLSLLRNGRVDHPPGGSKDEADALAGAVAGAIELGGDEGETPLHADRDTDVFSDDMGSPGGGALLPDHWEIGNLGPDRSGFGSVLW